MSSTHWEWTAGGGLEWVFEPHCSLKAEFIYYNVEHVSAGMTLTQLNGAEVPCTTIGIASSVDIVKGDIARGGSAACKKHSKYVSRCHLLLPACSIVDILRDSKRPQTSRCRGDRRLQAVRGRPARTASRRALDESASPIERSIAWAQRSAF